MGEGGSDSWRQLGNRTLGSCDVRGIVKLGLWGILMLRPLEIVMVGLRGRFDDKN